MRCAEFEQSLQERADGEVSTGNDLMMREHARTCSSCRELYDGFELLGRSFAATRVPPVPVRLSDRVCQTSIESPRRRSLQPLMWLVAACVLVALGLWLRNAPSDPASQVASNELDKPGSQPDAVAGDGALFPELADSHTADLREPIALVDAVEPISQLLRAFGKSLGGPVRPIAASTSEAMSTLLKELPDPESYPVPIPMLREMKGNGPAGDMRSMSPSSS
jgi:hypothetical protein